MAENISLPPGFKFYPTDEDLIVHYLYRKVMLLPCYPDFIPEIDLYNYNPWELPGEAFGGSKEWYLYNQRPRNHRKNSINHDRPAASGHWRVTSTDEPILNGSSVVGCRRSLVFYIGKAPSGIKTDWVMDEYSLLESMTRIKKSGNSKSVSGDWVLCRIQEGDHDLGTSCGDDGRELSYLDEIFFSLDDLDEISSTSKLSTPLFH